MESPRGSGEELTELKTPLAWPGRRRADENCRPERRLWSGEPVVDERIGTIPHEQPGPARVAIECNSVPRTIPCYCRASISDIATRTGITPAMKLPCERDNACPLRSSLLVRWLAILGGGSRPTAAIDARRRSSGEYCHLARLAILVARVVCVHAHCNSCPDMPVHSSR
jgi:hypothetical protein